MAKIEHPFKGFPKEAEVKILKEMLKRVKEYPELIHNLKMPNNPYFQEIFMEAKGVKKLLSILENGQLHKDTENKFAILLQEIVTFQATARAELASYHEVRKIFKNPINVEYFSKFFGSDS